MDYHSHYRLAILRLRRQAIVENRQEFERNQKRARAKKKIEEKLREHGVNIPEGTEVGEVVLDAQHPLAQMLIRMGRQAREEEEEEVKKVRASGLLQ